MTDSERLEPTEKESYPCHFCGTLVKDGYETGPNKDVRHYLSDCRPDLVEHEPGELCTWPAIPGVREESDCYAYRVMNSKGGFIITEKHGNFHKDGPT